MISLIDCLNEQTTYPLSVVNVIDIVFTQNQKNHRKKVKKVIDWLLVAESEQTVRIVLLCHRENIP